MPLWEGIFASFCAGVAVSLINRFGLSQIKTPCEKRLEAARDTSDSSSDEGSHVGATSAAIVDIHVHSHGD